MTDETKAIVARSVRAYRVAANLSIEAAAERLDLPVRDYVDSEEGRITFTAIELFHLARRLGVSIEQFFQEPGKNH